MTTPTLAQATELFDRSMGQVAALAAEAQQLASDPANLWPVESLLAEEIPAALRMARTARVAAWRAQGVTWEQVGERLNVSHQAARQRFAPEITGLFRDGVFAQVADLEAH